MFTTDKPVNVSQLGYELGGISARWIDRDGVVTCVCDDITEEQWDAAVAAHVADPGWVDPTPQPHQPLDPAGVVATLNAVLGVWSLTDAANAVRLPEQSLVDEASAWAELAAAAAG